MPANAAFPFLDWPGPLPFAHRGGASEAPENTMPAFEQAVRLGYRYLETDVHVTSDGELLAFHDDRLDRVTDASGAISELPWARVREARVDGREPIPRFEDLLGTWPEVRVNVDPKHDDAVEPLAEVLRRTGAVDRVCVGAFSDRRLDRLQVLVGARLCRSMGPRQVARLVAASRGLPGGGGVTAPCAQIPTHQGRIPLVTERLVKAAHLRGIQVHVWTIDDPSEMRRLLDLGVDGIMTDRPQVLKDVLIERGEWHEGPA
ncbi:MAG TPA: glycerophosphodiester phosphodiesterase [Acidimicrobiales bacterium]|nr:glycerophosphodiester phosphodiesterase [Acidimicrobiales bacterium]